ncbi:MAG: type II secretion system protein [Verrucomicrobiales bacterium]|nr:type II secretion system protein [Verrucomicrobiales bacterium]
MKTPRHSIVRSCRGLSLVEITLVIGLMLALASIVTYSVGSLTDWRKGRDASEKLRAVYMAQKSFLADQPSKSYATFTDADLIPYLPGRPGAMPVQTGKNGEELNINIQVMPPVLRQGTTTYDPSSSTTDGLWDVGSM